MSKFEVFTVAAFVVIFGCIGFLFYAVLSPASPVEAIEEPIVLDPDFEELFVNEYIFIADKPGGLTYEEYLNNLEYYKEEIYNSFKSSPEVVSFLYYDIATGYTFSYNEDVEIPTSSSIKASLAIYIMDQVSQGNADLQKKLTYTESFYNGGSGRIKNSPPGTEYSVEQLLEYMIIDSDNVAYIMLLNEFGSKNSRAYWLSHGTTTTYKSGGSWGTISANDGLIYMKRLFTLYREDERYGEKLMGLFKRARYRFLFNSTRDVEVAHKSGNTVASMNDLSIVFDKQPFIFIVLTRKNAFEGHMGFFSKASADIFAFHQYFWDNIGYRYVP